MFVLSNFVKPVSVVKDDGRVLLMTPIRSEFDTLLNNLQVFKDPCFARIKSVPDPGPRPDGIYGASSLLGIGSKRTHYFIELNDCFCSLQTFSQYDNQLTQYDLKCIIFELINAVKSKGGLLIAPESIMLSRVDCDRLYITPSVDEYRICSEFFPTIIPVRHSANMKDQMKDLINYICKNFVDLSVDLVSDIKILIDNGLDLSSPFFDDLIYNDSSRSHYLARKDCITISQ